MLRARLVTAKLFISQGFAGSKTGGSIQFGFKKACGASVSRLDGTFFRVNVTIDYLEVGQAPIGEQIRPRRFPVFAPHPKQRDAVVNFGILPQPSAALAAAQRLQPPQEPGVVTRHVPKLPRDHTGAMPSRIHVGAATPKIDMPTEAIDRLAAHAAESWTLHVCAFAIGVRSSSICGRQSMLAVIAELPTAVDVWCLVTHHAAAVGTDVPEPDVVAPDDDDVRPLWLRLRMYRTGKPEQRGHRYARKHVEFWPIGFFWSSNLDRTHGFLQILIRSNKPPQRKT